MKTVQVKFVNPPKPGKKMGNIKLEDGSQIYFYPDKHQFNKGSYQVETEMQTWGDKTVEVVKSVQAAANGGGKYGQTDLTTAERIYVCGILNAWVGRPDAEVTASALVAVTNAAREAWGETFGEKPKDEMDESIPF